jgi:hypothetical protein
MFKYVYVWDTDKRGKGGSDWLPQSSSCLGIWRMKEEYDKNKRHLLATGNRNFLTRNLFVAWEIFITVDFNLN